MVKFVIYTSNLPFMPKSMDVRGIDILTVIRSVTLLKRKSSSQSNLHNCVWEYAEVLNSCVL